MAAKKVRVRKGFTLVELSLSIAFIAILSITIALIISNAIFLNNKYNETVGVISSRKTGVVAKDNWFGNNATNK